MMKAEYTPISFGTVSLKM